MNPPVLHVISSMATKKLLADLTARYQPSHPDCLVRVESVGGVDAARRVRDGESFDAVALASDAIDQLMDSGHVVRGSRVDIVHSGVAAAVRAGAARPDIASEEALKRAVLEAPTIGYSTGPSGVQLQKLFERWGVAERIAGKIVTAPPGVPVGALVAKGEVALGFQQLSELMHLPGIDVIGALPQPVQITTIFSLGVARTSARPDAVRALQTFLASPELADIKRANGMAPA